MGWYPIKMKSQVIKNDLNLTKKNAGIKNKFYF